MIDSESPATPGPASSALEPPRARRLIVGILVGAGLLIAALVYLYGAFQAADLVNTNPEKGNQMAYLHYGYRLWESGYTFKQDRNRMPALPMILAVTYQKGWHLEDDFFPRAKTLSVLLSLFCLGVVGAAVCVTLGRAPGLVLTLVLAFTLYIYRAAYVQAEVLYYTSSGLVFIGALALLRRPVWWGAVALGVVMGLTYLTKASILPAVGLAAMVLAARQGWAWWRERKTAGETDVPCWRKLAQMLVPALLVPLTYLVTISPYLYNSKQIYGYAFYNVNSTFYIWCDSFKQAKDTVRKYNDRRGYPDIPPDKVPSAQRYLATHNPQQIWARLSLGMRQQVKNLLTCYGAAKYLGLLLALGVVLSWPVRGRWRAALASHFWELLFAAGFLGAFFLLISFYSAIANGPRFIFSLYLPVLFLIFYWIWRLPEWRPRFFSNLRIPATIGIRAVCVALMLVMLAADSWIKVCKFLPRYYTGM
jgi:hypothetical protein